ncbi:MAG: VOC family protein [Halanaerobiaceae bacterium]
MIKDFDHVTITVSDLERSVQFYRDILGLKVAGMLEQNDGNFKLVYLKAGDTLLELFYFTEKGDPLPGTEDIDIGIKHFGFKVESVDEVTRKLKEQDVEFTLEPLDATGGVRIAFFKDPDGVLLEIVEGELELKPYNLQ